MTPRDAERHIAVGAPDWNFSSSGALTGRTWDADETIGLQLIRQLFELDSRSQLGHQRVKLGSGTSKPKTRSFLPASTRENIYRV